MMQTDAGDMLRLDGVAKTFIMHLQGGARLGVVEGVGFTVGRGECVVLGGPSGIGKSSILKMIYGNYRTDAGAIQVRHSGGPDGGWLDVATASPRDILAMRRLTVGYVSQFLRVIPRVGALDIVAAAAMDGGAAGDAPVAGEADAAGDGAAPAIADGDPGSAGRAANARARDLLLRLNVPERLWNLPPATFSGGEQQRINIASGFAARRPVLLLDEPTASLDAVNRAVVMELIEARKREGVAILGIFHDEEVRARVADRIVDVTAFQPRLKAPADADSEARQHA